MTVIPHADVPKGLVTPAAYCTADFDVVCKRIAATPVVRYITYSKRLEKSRERYRCVSLRLASGRFATLLKEDNEIYFEIRLQREGYGYYLIEIEEVRKSISVRNEDIVLLDNALKWIQPGTSKPINFNKISIGWDDPN